ncbi:MAG: hypothetical protein JWR63_4236 [Conexibacter sp.]|nr:hypothetical protein [Conexibacter sp.]
MTAERRADRAESDADAAVAVFVLALRTAAA